MHNTYSLIIPCYNAESTLGFTLESILNQNDFSPLEVIVVDNNSTDGSAELASRFGVKVIQCPVQGAGAARNAGAKVATGSHLVFVDADVMLPAHWLQTLDQEYHKYKWIEGITGNLIPMGLKKSLLTRFRKFILRTKSQGQMNLLGASTPVLNSALFSIRHKTFHSLGGFDESFKRMEDSHLGHKAFHASLNFKTHPLDAGVYYCPDSYADYFVRSFHVGYWFKKVHGSANFRNYFSLDSKEDPLMHSMLLFNNLIFLSGYLAGCLGKSQKITYQTSPSKNSFHGQVKYKNELYVMNAWVSLIALPQMIRIYSSGKVVHECKGPSKDFLLRVLQKEHQSISSEEELIMEDWIQKQLFIKA